MTEYNTITYLLYLHLQALKNEIAEVERVRNMVLYEPERLNYEDSEMISNICYLAIDSFFALDGGTYTVEKMLGEELKELFNRRAA